MVIAFGFPYTPDNIDSVPALNVIFALLPWSLLAKASWDLGAASVASGPQGIQWSTRGSYCQNIQDPEAQARAFVPGVYQNFDCVLSIETIMIFLTLEALAYFVLAVYLDNILPNEQGARRGVSCAGLVRVWSAWPRLVESWGQRTTITALVHCQAQPPAHTSPALQACVRSPGTSCCLRTGAGTGRLPFPLPKPSAGFGECSRQGLGQNCMLGIL